MVSKNMTSKKLIFFLFFLYQAEIGLVEVDKAAQSVETAEVVFTAE